MATKKNTPTDTAVIESPKAAVDEHAATKKNQAATKVKTVTQLAAELEKPLKTKKKTNDKVIRDSFSFPEMDYLKILQIKAICLSEGLHVKKGEVLRAGINLLMQLNQEELKQVIGEVERVKTGRPLSVKE